MGALTSALSTAYRLLDTNLNLYGFSFSYWDVILWSMIASVIGVMIVRFFVE